MVRPSLFGNSSETACEITEKFLELNLSNLLDLKKVTKLRRKLEVNSTFWGKNIEWYKLYIDTEKDILERIQTAKRYAETVEHTEETNAYELKFKKRICRLYNIGMQCFPHDFDLSVQYFEFCKDNIIAAAKAAELLMHHFWHKPEAWKEVIRYHAYDRKDKKIASVLMNYTLETEHKHSPVILKEAIELEVTDFEEEPVEECFKRRKPLPDEEKVTKIVETILEKVNDFSFWIEILQMLGNRDTKNVQNLIIDKLEELHPTEADTWNAIAQKYFKDFLDKPDLDEPRTSEKSNLEICFETYQNGMLKVAPTQKTELLIYYLDCLVECRQAFPNDLQHKTLLSTFRNVSQNILTEKHYIVWIDSLINEYHLVQDPEEKEEIYRETFSVIDRAFVHAPDSVTVSIMQLRAAIIIADLTVIEQVFTKAVETLKNQSLLVWVFKLTSVVPNTKEAEAFFRKAIKGPDDVCEFFRCRYLDWLSMYKDITEIRQKYHEIAQLKPYSRELHSIMVRVEFFQDPPNPEEWEKVALNITKQFGSNDVIVWLYYGVFLTRFREQGIDDMLKRARLQLTRQAFENFEQRFQVAKQFELNLQESQIMGFIETLGQEVRRMFREEREVLQREGGVPMEETDDTS